MAFNNILHHLHRVRVFSLALEDLTAAHGWCDSGVPLGSHRNIAVRGAELEWDDGFAILPRRIRSCLCTWSDLSIFFLLSPPRNRVPLRDLRFRGPSRIHIRRCASLWDH